MDPVPAEPSLTLYIFCFQATHIIPDNLSTVEGAGFGQSMDCVVLGQNPSGQLVMFDRKSGQVTVDNQTLHGVTVLTDGGIDSNAEPQAISNAILSMSIPYAVESSIIDEHVAEDSHPLSETVDIKCEDETMGEQDQLTETVNLESSSEIS